jgi:hypothetical protein
MLIPLCCSRFREFVQLHEALQREIKVVHAAACCVLHVARCVLQHGLVSHAAAAAALLFAASAPIAHRRRGTV